MNLKAMDIIIAISCEGTPSFDRGAISFSSPSVKAIGFVVSVKTDELIISRISLRLIKSAR